MAVELTSIEPLLEIINARPPGILSDIDGTLAPIVPDPAAAAITPRARDLLAGLVARGVRVALVTGRELDAARRIVGLDGVAYAANHGLHIYHSGVCETMEAVQPYEEQARAVLAEISEQIHPGVTIEDKGPVLAFHYRNAADEGAARAAILSALRRARSASGFAVYEGRKVIELRPPLDINKGTAILYLAERLGMRSAIAIGDDMTDIDMFRGLDTLKSRGLPGAKVSVLSDESPPELLEATDYFVRGVPGVEWLLQEVLKALPESQPEGP